MNNIQKLTLALLTTLLLALLSSYFLSKAKYNHRDAARFQKKLDRQVELLDQTVKNLFRSGDIEPFESLRNKGIIILAYRNDSIYNWTDNSIEFPDLYNSAYYEKKLVFNLNTWYVCKTYANLPYRVIGFITLKHEYSEENRFLKSGFQRTFNLPPEIDIYPEKKDGALWVNDWNGNFLLSLITAGIPKYQVLRKYLPAILYFLSFIILLQLFTVYMKRLPQGIQKNWAITGMGLLFLLFRFSQTIFRIPLALYHIELFSPVYFANSELLPSLGDLLLNTIIIFFLIIAFHRDFYIRVKTSATRTRTSTLQIICMIFFVGFILYVYYIFKSLIDNSSISFEAYKLTGLSVFSLVGLIIIGLNFVSVVFILDKIITICKKNTTIEKMIFIFSMVFILSLISLSFSGFRIDPYSALFFFIIFIIIAIIKYRRESLYNYSIMVILVLLFSVYSVYFISVTTSQKERQNMIILAENLATEHDPVAELLLEEMSGKMENDRNLAAMLHDMNVSYQNIYDYLHNNYFSGFWGKYNFQFFDCRPYDSVIFEVPVEYNYPCYEFFNGLIGDKGMQLPNSRFYYINNLNGKINYLGRIRFADRSQDNEITLFIELESRLVSENLGYPEVLLNENLRSEPYMKEYSYAKYHKNILITQSGSFHYSLDRKVYDEQQAEYAFLRFDNYDHLVYNIDSENTIILSKPSVTFFDLLISFSYIFAFFYILLVTTLLVINLSQLDRPVSFNFKNKIQVAIISILLLSLILIGGGTIYFSIEQYQKKNNDNISEKIQSVYIELDHKLAYENELDMYWSSADYSNLTQLLVKFSDVFYTDINLYSPLGDLLATSRPEIFEQGLIGTKMNPDAYLKLDKENRAEYIHREQIGKLKYLSAYVPFINSNNKLLAYLNLPYFTKEDRLRREITTLVVAVVNVYVLLILLTIAVAIFISDKITKPLRLLQEKFGEIDLLKDHELIEYNGSDEVAGLISEYNRMVQELHRSAELLARSERESAWREMARQIAHEIKNPLTPMKLTIQHLQRAWKDKKENYNEIQEKVTRTLIEQIDNLSKIASEFSNFAQMPKARNEKLNLTKKLKDTLALFSGSGNAKIIFHNNARNDVVIFADKEQISRVFINLVNNGLQSIPDERKGRIDVTIDEHSGKAIVRVSDNGKGIPDELKDKLFMPNFTTKSSGMGLGLAISKSIIENNKGTIRFETAYNTGTTFIIELPVYAESSRDTE